MKNLYRLTASMFLSMILISCQSGVTPVTTRGVGIQKPGDLPHPMSTSGNERPEIFVKRKTVKIAPKETTNQTGSLFRMDDQRNYLYLAKAPFAVGQYVDVKVIANASSPDTKDAKKEAGKDKAEEELNNDATLKEILASLPKFDPGENAPKLLSRFKMKIDYVYENGDALGVFTRTSTNPEETSDIRIKARIPFASLISGSDITTKDLTEVHWQEIADGQGTERYSGSWEDEYSLRLSGFNEAKTKYAREIEDKRKQMEESREKLKNQLISVGKERKTMAKEREKLLKDKAENEKKLGELEKKVDEQKATIDEQKDKLDEQAKLAQEQAAVAETEPPEADTGKKEEKPGDKKDGAKGK